MMNMSSLSSSAGQPQLDFSVDANGEATFHLGLDLPPGIASLTPKLDLTYTHRQTNGMMGVGWSCNGLSAIMRTKATYAADGFNGTIDYGPNDRYTLDGQRLINVQGEYGAAGTLYYTEIQSWHHIQETNGGFIVTAKDGSTMEYGMTADSCILAAGGSKVRVWALNAIADRNGNRIEYSYVQNVSPGDNGSYYPNQIRYTVRDGVTANRFVTFHYEPRPDTIVYYVGGYPVIMASRLKQIRTSLSSGDIDAYTMNYGVSAATELSRVESIVNSAGGVDLTCATVLWSDTPVPGLTMAGPPSALDRPGPPALIPMDVSGNGRTDMVHLWDDHGVLHANTYLATPGTEGIEFAFTSDSTLEFFPKKRQIYPVNVDGDGRTDLLIAYQNPDDSLLYLAVYLSNGAGFTAADGSPYSTGDPWDDATLLNFFAMDVNGDGRTDFVESYDDNGTLSFRSYLSQFGPGSTGFTPAIVSATDYPARPQDVYAFWAMDVSGDGMMDLVRVWRDTDSSVHVTSFVSVSTAIDQVTFASSVDTNLGIFGLEDRAFLPVDVNGDGNQDLLHIWFSPDGRTLNLTTYLSNAAAGFVEGPSSAFENQTIDLTQLLSMGLNGCGQPSLVCPWKDVNQNWNFTVFQGSPSGIFRLLPAGAPISADPNSIFYAGDPDANGKADLIQVYADIDHIPQLVPFLSVGPYNDLATSVTNGLGGVVTIEYAPLSDSAVYQPAAPEFPNGAGLRYPTPLTPAQFPAQAVLGDAVYVVQSYTRSNDAAINRLAYSFGQQITYSGAQVNLLGRGWQGFHIMRSTRLDNGQVLQQTFNQNFPLTGTLAETRVEADGKYASDPRVPKDQTVLMRVVTTTYNVVTTAGSSSVRREAFQTAEFDYGEENFDFQLAQTFAYDDYDNVTNEVNLGYVDRATNQPLYPDEVVYRYKSYRNDVFRNGWALGFLFYSKVSANCVDADISKFLPGDLQLEQKLYADGTYNLISDAKWDDSNHVYLTSTNSYDVYGNRVVQTLPGGAPTQYAYEPDFHTYKMTVTFPPNEQGDSLVSSYGYDPRFGVEVARCDPNGSIFITAFDSFGRKTLMQGPVPQGPFSMQTSLRNW